MPLFRIHTLLQFLTKRRVFAFLWRLLIPIIFILAIPAAEHFLQHLFMAEGILRVGMQLLTLRGTAFFGLRPVGICLSGFLLEESIQEFCLWFLI